MLPDSFSEHLDLPMSLLCFHRFTGFLVSRGSNTSCLCFALTSFLIKPQSAFQNFFTFTLLPGSSALLQTPVCSEYHHSEQSPVVNALSLCTVCICTVCVCTVCVCVCLYYVCVCVCMHVLYALNLENMCIKRMCKHLGPVQIRHSKYLLLLLYSGLTSSLTQFLQLTEL